MSNLYCAIYNLKDKTGSTSGYIFPIYGFQMAFGMNWRVRDKNGEWYFLKILDDGCIEFLGETFSDIRISGEILESEKFEMLTNEDWTAEMV